MAEIDSWVESQEFQITLDAQGKIIDYIVSASGAKSTDNVGLIAYNVV